MGRLDVRMAIGLAAAAVVLFVVLTAAGTAPVTGGAVAVVLLVAATAQASFGWRAATAREEQLTGVSETLREERERLGRQNRRLEAALSHDRVLLRRLRDSWRAEREWSHELRTQLHELHGRSSGRSTVLELVLEAVIRLVDARKGLLLARTDEDGDGDLDLVLAAGFSSDPEHSAVAQRFAREVLARDQIVREDAPPKAAATPADAEIESLVAVPLYLRDRFHGVVVCANRPEGFADVDDDVLLALGNQAGAALHHGELQRELRDARHAVVRVLAEAAAGRDPVLHRESVALSALAGGLAADLQLSDRERDALVVATLLRAVGYLALPERMLLRPGPLTPDERALISLHPRLGFDILRQAPALREPALAVLYHHERCDGRGYPAGLVGDDIPITARALSVLEAYGAMTHDRPHRGARSSEDACRELIEQAGTQFDPEIVQLLVERVRQAPVKAEDGTDAILEGLPLDRGDSDGLHTATVDGLTLLGDHRALQRAVRELVSGATHDRRFAIVLVQLDDLPRINEELGHVAGDRLIEVAARRAASVATRLGATAYRVSGRRLALQLPLRAGDDLGNLLEEVRTEYMGGPAVEVVASAWKPGDSGEEVLARARRALRRASA